MTNSDELIERMYAFDINMCTFDISNVYIHLLTIKTTFYIALIVSLQTRPNLC